MPDIEWKYGGVAPLAGAWIEIFNGVCFLALALVAPLAGAWIEIKQHILLSLLSPSLPSRERGLKFLCNTLLYYPLLVAPLAGAWIEISPILF